MTCALPWMWFRATDFLVMCGIVGSGDIDDVEDSTTKSLFLLPICENGLGSHKLGICRAYAQTRWLAFLESGPG